MHFYAAAFSDVVAATRTTVLALEINIQDTATVDSTTWMVLGTKGVSLMSYGEVVGLAVVSGRHCDSFSQTNNCIATGTLESLGIMLAGGLVGAMVGSASPSWKPRYP